MGRNGSKIKVSLFTVKHIMLAKFLFLLKFIENLEPRDKKIITIILAVLQITLIPVLNEQFTAHSDQEAETSSNRRLQVSLLVYFKEAETTE